MPLTLPHPQEPNDNSVTLANIDIPLILAEWLSSYDVPLEYHDYWLSMIIVEAVDNYPSWLIISNDTPACSFDLNGVRHVMGHPAWLNPGVIAHEQAHNSYALLTDEQETAFSLAYTPLKDTDPMIKFLYSQNNYGLKNDIEGHAELYRYGCVPEILKSYYPKLYSV
ncbi:MAG: hypothetical protein WC417_07310 [Candidatus Omnitrophota bacterium]